MLPWTKQDDLWVPLPADKRQIWTPEQIEIYDTYTWRNQVRRTPATFAKAVNTQWLDLPHVIFIAEAVADFVNGRLIAPNGKPARKLFLTMPPRHGKSFLMSEHVPSWYLTCFPDRYVILTTYGDDFAAKWGGKNRALMQEHGAKFGLTLDQSSQAKNRWALGRPYRGGMITAGKGGPITGEGGGLLVGDDWIKSGAEAFSDVMRENDWDWYNTTFRTRGQKDLQDTSAPPPLTLLLMTRWHDDDVMGRLLKAQSEDMVVIHLPAIAGENDVLGRAPGEALCPQIMSVDELLDLKKGDPFSFNALYQGDPTPDEGGLFSKSAFRSWSYYGEEQGVKMTDNYVLHTPEGGQITVPVKECKHFITVDLAISERKRADYSVFGAYALTPNRDLLLISQFRERIEEAKHLPSLHRFYDEVNLALNGHARVLQVGIEKQTFGLTLLKNARRETGMPVRELEADRDKVSRAMPLAAKVSGGQFYLPKHWEEQADFITEHCLFPTGAHDDQVDTASYAAILCETTFRGLSTYSRRQATEEAGDGTVDAHIAKIAARNAKARRNRGRL